MLWSKRYYIIIIGVIPFFKALDLKWMLYVSRVSHPEISHTWCIDFFSLIIAWIFSFICHGLYLSLLQSWRVFKCIIIFLWIACAITHSSISSYLIALKKSDSLSTLIFLSKFRALCTPGIFSVLLGWQVVEGRWMVRYWCLLQRPTQSYLMHILYPAGIYKNSR